MEREISVAKLEGTSVKLYDAKGRYIRSLPAGNAVSVDVSGGAVAITFRNGQVKLYDRKGKYVRTL